MKKLSSKLLLGVLGNLSMARTHVPNSHVGNGLCIHPREPSFSGCPSECYRCQALPPLMSHHYHCNQTLGSVEQMNDTGPVMTSAEQMNDIQQLECMVINVALILHAAENRCWGFSSAGDD